MPKVRLFQSKLILSEIGKEAADDLLSDFRLYKEKGGLPATFGRDAPYRMVECLSFVFFSVVLISASPR